MTAEIENLIIELEEKVKKNLLKYTNRNKRGNTRKIRR